jgi:Tfp pilus assembly protein PilN
MLRTNLSTRPFYNERLVHLVLGALALAVAAVTVFNLWQVFVLSSRHAVLQARITEADGRARAARTDASRIRAGINPRELETASVAAREANAIIERRAFSWTDLFNRFESTLPDTVRITSVVPRVDKDGVVTVTVVVLARTVEGVEAFIENLEEDGAFSGFLSTEEFPDETDTLQATLVGRYMPPAAQKGARP